MEARTKIALSWLLWQADKFSSTAAMAKSQHDALNSKYGLWITRDYWRLLEITKKVLR